MKDFDDALCVRIMRTNELHTVASIAIAKLIVSKIYTLSKWHL